MSKTSINLYVDQDTDEDLVLNRLYNVEYESGHSVANFSNILKKADGTYFWFSSEESGLDCVRQDKIIAITCCDKHQCKNKRNCSRYAYKDISKNDFYVKYLENILKTQNIASAFKNTCKQFDVYYNINLLNLAIDREDGFRGICDYYFRSLTLKQFTHKSYCDT